MSLNANNAPGGGSPTEPIDAGTYPARLVQVIDLGLQPQRPYQGQDKPPARELQVTYEFVDEFLKDADGNDIPDKPRWKSERFPFYNLGSEKAKSTKRYLALDPNQEKKGDWGQLLSAPCLVTIVHNPRKDGKPGVYDNIGAVTTMRAKDAEKLPDLVNEPRSFDLDSPDMDVFASLPDWLQTVITENLEFEGSKLQSILANEGPEKSDEGSSTNLDDALEGDENPY